MFYRKKISRDTTRETIRRYYQVSERIFSLAEQAKSQKDWEKLYIYMKRYMMLTARELKKHNAFGQARYRVDRETARARCLVAIDNIKLATQHLKASLVETPPSAPKITTTSTTSTATTASVPELDSLMHRLQVLSGDSTDAETSKRLKEIEIQSGVTEQPPPSAPPMMDQDDEKFDKKVQPIIRKEQPFTAEEKAALDRLRLPSAAYAESNRIKSVPKVRTQSPYASLLKSLQIDDEKDYRKGSGQLPAYMRYNGGSGGTGSKRRMSTGGVNEKDRAFRKSLLSARGMRIVDCKMV